jgi:hypothetical protein
MIIMFVSAGGSLLLLASGYVATVITIIVILLFVLVALIVRVMR